MKVLAALIVNKVPAFGTAGCTNDDVLHFVTVQGQAKVDIKLRSEHLHMYTFYSEPSNNLGALKRKQGLFLCELGECSHR